jgi:cholesterol oxidase
MPRYNKGHTISRRDFLLTMAAGAGYLLGNPTKSNGTLNFTEDSEEVKALVIGSGFGGAVAALRLAQAGIDVTIIERGKRWPITDEQNTFSTIFKPDGRSAWLSPKTVLPGMDSTPINVFPGVLDRYNENGIGVLAGAGVGGGSLVYGGVTFQPSRELFYRTFPSEIDYGELDRVYFPRVRSTLNATVMPKDIFASNNYKAARVFIQQAKKAGLPTSLLEGAVDWNIVRQELAGRRVPSVIVGEGVYGINSGAKNSLDRNYLAMAEATGRVSIRTLHIVTDIAQERDNRFTVICNVIDLTGQVVSKKIFICESLFLAAGSMGTSKLLVRAKAKGTLPNLNDDIGKDWGNNGDNLFLRIGLKKTGKIQGGFAGASAFDPGNSVGPVTLEQAQFPIGFECNCINHLSMSIPAVRGFFSYKSETDSVSLTWPSGANNDTTAATRKTADLINGANGGTVSDPPGVDSRFTFHPLGGAVLGKACDLFGRVKGYTKLYVVDGALIPGATGCSNPSLTIAAIAERCMDQIIKEV